MEEHEDLLEPKKTMRAKKANTNEVPIIPKSDVTTISTKPAAKKIKAKKKEKAAIFDLEGKLLHVRVGDSNKPSTDNDIADIQGKLESLLESNGVTCMVFVTHHAVEMKVVP